MPVSVSGYPPSPSRCVCEKPGQSFRCANGRLICSVCGDDAQIHRDSFPPAPSEARMREIAIDEAERAVRNNEAQKDFLLRQERARTKYRGHPIRYCETCNDWHLCSLDKR
jgi:hypothetical protein